VVAGEILYTLFIWPIRFILEFLFVLFNRIFSAPGPAILFLSVVVNTLSLPMYLIADRWQKEERELQKRMKKKLDSIRSAFKGDERQMVINAYYRQTGYSPVLLLKASVGLLLQIPFFIAAYQFLSRTSMLSGVPFLFLKDLNAPDGLLPLPLPWLPSLNLMPLIMTAVNLASSLIYTKGLGKRERMQLFGMALVFLVLLYDSPSGLVLYWTMNNVYSLIKNAAHAALKKPGKALQYAAALFAVAFLYLIWSGRANVERYRLLFTAMALVLAAIPFIWRSLLLLLANKPDTDKEGTAFGGGGMDVLYFSAIVLIFLLLGWLNPAQVLSASVSDFETPWVFFVRTFFQSLSFCILIPLFIRALSPVPVRRVLAAGGAVLALSGMVCYFALSAYYGVMDRNFKLDDTNRLLHAFPLWISIAVPLGAAACTAVFIRLKKEKILAAFFQIACAALFVLGIVNVVSLQKQSVQMAALAGGRTPAGNISSVNDAAAHDTNRLFPLSKQQPNVFIVFLDRAQGSAMTDALEYMPNLQNDLDGFTFYPNTLSFGGCTVTGIPAMLGGYDYMPLSVNQRKDEMLTDKVNEAITAMPRFFGEAGYRVTITDPVIANMQSVPDISIFKDMPNVTARLLSGKLTDRFRSEFPGEEKTGADSFDFDILFRYGVFRLSLPALRYGIHYKGQWWREAAYNSYGRAVAEFSSLYYLPELCFTDEGAGTLNIFMSAVTHESGAYNAELFPQSKPVEFSEEEKSSYGSEENAEYMYTLLSAMKQLVKWLDYLKQQGVYDNTRIIVVADHGGNYNSGFDTAGMEGFNPLLMVKEPGARGALAVSGDFMTHADTPYLASEKLNEAEEAKRKVLTAVSAVSSQPLRHGPYEFSLDKIRTLKGREVLKKENWGEWETP
jgi:YidC/Oxa1 family membrane protein insertase